MFLKQLSHLKNSRQMPLTIDNGQTAEQHKAMGSLHSFYDLSFLFVYFSNKIVCLFELLAAVSLDILNLRALKTPKPMAVTSLDLNLLLASFTVHYVPSQRRSFIYLF